MRVITFSTYYPKVHPKAGLLTQFVEKIWLSLIDDGQISMSKAVELSRYTGIGDLDMYKLRKLDLDPKGHTIRAGNRWKVGDKFYPRIWSGKPYCSKQIQFAPPIEIKKIWDFEINEFEWSINTTSMGSFIDTNDDLCEIAKNDGLYIIDFINWFNIHPKSKSNMFKGQILAWSDKIEY